jgi:hypothetical protein
LRLKNSHSNANIQRQTPDAKRMKAGVEDMGRTRLPLNHRRASIICAIATTHLLLWVALFVLWTADTMARFDGSHDSGLGTLVLNGAYEALSFPLVTAFQLLKVARLGIFGWLAILSNSFVWGWVAWRGIRFWRTRGVASN